MKWGGFFYCMSGWRKKEKGAEGWTKREEGNYKKFCASLQISKSKYVGNKFTLVRGQPT